MIRRCCTKKVLLFLTDEGSPDYYDALTICGSSLFNAKNKCDCYLNMSCFDSDAYGVPHRRIRGDRYLVTCKDCIKIMKANGL